MPHESGMMVTVLGVVSRDQRLNCRRCDGNARIVAMTRSSNDALTLTGPRSSRAASPITKLPSGSSRTVHLAQQLAESFTCAHDTHLERRDSHSGQLRHLVVSHLLDILQKEGFALV